MILFAIRVVRVLKQPKPNMWNGVAESPFIEGEYMTSREGTTVSPRTHHQLVNVAFIADDRIEQEIDHCRKLWPSVLFEQVTYAIVEAEAARCQCNQDGNYCNAHPNCNDCACPKHGHGRDGCNGWKIDCSCLAYRLPVEKTGSDPDLPSSS
jgi:hypothetical protein